MLFRSKGSEAFCKQKELRQVFCQRADNDLCLVYEPYSYLCTNMKECLNPLPMAKQNRQRGGIHCLWQCVSPRLPLQAESPLAHVRTHFLICEQIKRRGSTLPSVNKNTVPKWYCIFIGAPQLTSVEHLCKKSEKPYGIMGCGTFVKM